MSFYILTSMYIVWYYFINMDCKKKRDKDLKIPFKKLVLLGIGALAAGVILVLANKQEAPKYEHNIVFLGDSVIGNYAQFFSVTTVMEDRLGVDVYNGALGGTCMSFYVGNVRESVHSSQWSMVKLAQAIYAEDWTSQVAGVSYSENYRESAGQILDYFYERILHLSQTDFSKVDILIMEHGTNDYNCGQVLESEEDPWDITTYAGAIRTTVKLLTEKYPDLRIILVSPIYCEFIDEDNAKCYETDFGGGVLDDYVQMQKTVAEECGVEWINAYHGSGIWSDTIDIYTYDKLHLTDEGKQLIGDLIADYLEENPSKPVQ